jgi:predicted NBD/HSP70 family sugar kinase
MEGLATGSLASLRERNRRSLISSLSERGMASRADLARLTGLSRSTVSSLVAEMQATGLVEERHASASGGRPGVLLALSRGAGVVVAADFGHHRLRVAVFDLSHSVLADAVHDVDIDEPAEAAMATATAAIYDTLDRAGASMGEVVGVGMGLPGPISRDTGTLGSSTILPAWVGVPVAAAMTKRLGVPVYADNDANLGVLAEVTFGAGRGCTEAAYLKISSGIGAGLYMEGHIYRGRNGTAGEIGHVILDEEGLVCRCGNRGCLETLAGEQGIVDALRRSHGPDLDLARVLELAKGGDIGCARMIADAGAAIGRAAASLCNLFNPQRVIVGGSLSPAGDLLLEPLRAAVERYAIPSAARDVQIVPGELGARTETLGALALVIAESDRLVGGSHTHPPAGRVVGV